jgi:peptide/nickel transport system permease protein
MFAGAIIVESIFNWPGLNRMLISAVTNRDYPLIQGTVLLTSAIYMLVTLLTDLTYSVLNPRIRYG